MKLRTRIEEGDNRIVLKNDSFFITKSNMEYKYSIDDIDTQSYLLTINFIFKNTDNSSDAFSISTKNLLADNKQLIITFNNINKSISDIIVLNEIDLFKVGGRHMARAAIIAKPHKDADIVELNISIVAEYIQ